MYQPFSVISVDVEEINRLITVTFSADIDESTISAKSLYLYKKADGEIIPLKYTIDNGKTLIINVADKIDVNVEYDLIINRDVKSIAEEQLAVAIRKSIIFNSSVDSIIEILAPSDHEATDTCLIVWSESKGVSEKLFNSYEIQVASDNAFFNTIVDTKVNDKKSVSLTVERYNQYFARVRAIDKDDFGNWSNIVTFTLTDIYFNKDKVTEEDDNIFIEDLELISYPVDNDTPKSFIFEFDSDIDIDSIEDQIIVVKRRI